MWHVAINEPPCVLVTPVDTRGSNKNAFRLVQVCLKAFVQTGQILVRYWIVKQAVRHPNQNISGFRDVRFVMFYKDVMG